LLELQLCTTIPKQIFLILYHAYTLFVGKSGISYELNDTLNCPGFFPSLFVLLLLIIVMFISNKTFGIPGQFSRLETMK
jgi:hypothetical protein